MTIQTPKRLLMDFYLNLLAIPVDGSFRIANQSLYSETLYALASELGADQQTIQDIFERMASEDK